MSPELVLVSSPEEIRAAIAQLPEEPWLVAPSTSAQLREEFAETDVYISPPKRGRARAFGLVALVLIAAGAIGYRVGTQSSDNDVDSLGVLRPPAVTQPARTPPTRTVSVAPTSQQSQSSPPARARTPSTKSRQTQSRVAPRTAGATPGTPRTSAHAEAKPRVRKKTSPPTAIAFVPSRTWAWAPAKDATAYEVTFFRGGQAVFRARPTEPRMVLPRGFRFQAGTYRWTVHALPAVAGATPIVDSSFVLTAAGAAKANQSAR